MLATVVGLDPIRVVFSVPDRQLLEVQEQFGARSPGELVGRFVPQLRLANGTVYPQPGRIEFVDNRVDPGTGTVAVRALFDNPGRLLLPGQFVTVEVRRERVEERPVVPVTAVQRDREGPFVLVLDGDNRVAPRRITLGPQVGQSFAVEGGLQPGETIVVDGLQKVRPGMTVQPVAASSRQASG
jgi:membrane fusion protein (multidrug efflux system)